MRGNRGALISFLMALAFSVGGGVSLARGEVTVMATGVSGDYGTGVESDTEWLTLRYVVGNEFQFRVDLPMIRADTTASGVTYTGRGPMSRGNHGSASAGMSTSERQSLAAAGEDGSSSTTGVGDMRFAVSGRILGGGVKRFRFDASVEVKVPTAEEDSNLGTGEWDYRVGLASEYRFWSSTVFGGFGWNRFGDTASLELDDIVDGYVGIDSDPFASDRLIATGWIEGWQPAVDTAGHRVAIGVGLRTTGKRRWRLQLRSGLTDASEDLAVSAGVSFGIAPSGPGSLGHQR